MLADTAAELRISKMRPIGVPTTFRNVWSGNAVKIIAADIARFCARRGQFGLTAAGPLVCAVMARHVLAAGGTTASEDKANSFMGSLAARM